MQVELGTWIVVGQLCRERGPRYGDPWGHQKSFGFGCKGEKGGRFSVFSEWEPQRGKSIMHEKDESEVQSQVEALTGAGLEEERR